MKSVDFPNSSVIGIKSELPGYRFCWMVNETLDTNFVRQSELDFGCSELGSGIVPMYQHTTLGHRYMIYKVNSAGADKNNDKVNYLWIVESRNAKAEAENLTTCLNEMPGVNYAKLVQIDIEKEMKRSLVA